MKWIISFACFIFLSFPIYSQYNISGVVISEKGNAIEFATVSIYPIADSSNLQGVVTDLQGVFYFPNLKKETYKVVVQMLGFQDLEKEIELVQNLNLGKIILLEEITLLKEVNVIAEYSTLESRLGKKVLRIGQDLSATGSNGLEALESIPSVTTTQKGQIQIRGSSNVIIYINGKETRRDPANLKYISAEALEKIEVITNPSAKYDAEGVAGIINLVYKNDKTAQFKLESIINLAVATNPVDWNPSGGLNASWTRNKFSIFSNISYDRGGYEDNFESARNNSMDSLQRYENRINTQGIGTVGNFNFGITLEPDTTLSIGLELNYDRWKITDESVQKNSFEYLDSPAQQIEFSNESEEIENELWINFSLEKKIKNQQNLKLSLTTGGEDEDNFFQSNDLELGGIPNTVEQFLLRSEEKESQRYYQGKLDFETPFFNFGKLEAGVKADFIKYDILQSVVLRSQTIAPPKNDFTMKMQKLGIYILQKHQIKKLEYAVGLRLEKFSSNAIQKTNEATFTQNYFRLFPSVQFNFLVPNSSQTIGFNYTRRINRPSFFDLNPLVSYTDPLNLRTGNPALAPEIANLYEISYHKEMEKWSADFTLFKRTTTDAIQPIIQTFGNNQTLEIPTNFAKETNQGVEATLEYRIHKFFKTNASFVWGQSEFSDLENQITFNQRQSWSLRLMQQFKFAKDWKIEISETYRAPQFSAQQKREENFYVNLAINKKFNSKKGSVSLRVKDIFNTRQFVYSLRTENFKVERTDKWQTRQVVLGLRYQIF